jgi:glyoxalase family protein
MISFKDPDGLQLQFIEPENEDSRNAWTIDGISNDNALKGFHNVTLTLQKADPTIKVLTDVLATVCKNRKTVTIASQLIL